MFTVSTFEKKEDQQSLKICIAIKNNLLIMEYQNTGPSTSGTGKFKKTKEFVLPDPCCVLSFCDMNNKICVGFKTEFNLIDIKTSQILELFVAQNKYSLLLIGNGRKELRSITR